MQINPTSRQIISLAVGFSTSWTTGRIIANLAGPVAKPHHQVAVMVTGLAAGLVTGKAAQRAVDNFIDEIIVPEKETRSQAYYSNRR